jgi:hypothetical protein
MHVRPGTQVGGHLLLVTPWLFEDYRAGFFFSPRVDGVTRVAGLVVVARFPIYRRDRCRNRCRNEPIVGTVV